MRVKGFGSYQFLIIDWANAPNQESFRHFVLGVNELLCINRCFEVCFLPMERRLLRGQLTLIYIAFEFTVEVDDGDLGGLNFY